MILWGNLEALDASGDLRGFMFSSHIVANGKVDTRVVTERFPFNDMPTAISAFGVEVNSMLANRNTGRSR